MRVVVLHNSKSGTGRRAELVERLIRSLHEAGHDVRQLAAGVHLSTEELASAARAADLAVIAGGDGTVHHALAALAHGATPMYHFPLGTENLFSREFGMRRETDALLESMRQGDVREMDLCQVNGRWFALMMSVGIDAAIVRRVAAGRTAGISRVAYARAAADELLSGRVPRVSLSVDGRTVIDHEQGLVIVANSRQYAARLDPVRNADMADGLLDVLFLPHRTGLGAMYWMAAVAAGTHLDASETVLLRGQRVIIECASEVGEDYQLDGEAAGTDTRLEVCVQPHALRVLVPPQRSVTDAF